MFTFRHKYDASLLYDTVLKNVIILIAQAVNPCPDKDFGNPANDGIALHSKGRV